MSWTWEFLDQDGSTTTGTDPGLAELRFENQSDAETWLGANYPELVDQNVAQVNLRHNENLIYGPMSLASE